MSNILPGPIIAPYLPTYAAREPYITPAEFKAYPTGITISQLVPGASEQVNADALAQQILAASGWADNYCHQTLAATLEVASGYWLVNQGVIRIVADQAPIIQVNAISMGSVADQTPLTSGIGVSIEPKVVTIPSTGQGASNGRVWATMEYVAGYANSLTTATSDIGDQTITVDNDLGIVPGLGLTVYDPGKTEVITITGIDDTGTILSLASPLRFGHAVGVSVSALPAAVKEAVVLFTTSLIKTRGSDAIVLSSMRSQPSEKQAVVTPSGKTERAKAEALLDEFMRAA